MPDSPWTSPLERVGIIVDAKPGAVGFYRRYGFIDLETLQGQSDARPQPLPMLVSMRQIRDAMGAG